MHKKSMYKAIVAIAVALAFMLPTSAVFANGNLTITNVRFDPSAQTVEKGETFTASYYVEPTELVAGAFFDTITFDPTLLQADSVAKGGFFGGKEMMFNGGTIDNVAGTIKDGLAVVLVGDAVNVAGAVYVITFTAKDQLGTSSLVMTGLVGKMIAGDEPGEYPDYTLESGSVTVEEYFDLTISVDGEGDTVPAPGVHTYTTGTVVDLTATPDIGWTFDSWTGPDAGEIVSSQITMTKDMFITAYFTQDCYDLVITPVGSGHVDVVPDKTCYLYGEEPELTAVADLGWTFDSWSVDLTGSVNPETILMDDDKAVTATFTEDCYTLTIIIDSEAVAAGCHVDVVPDKTCYLYGEEPELTAVPGANWAFTGWEGDLSGTELVKTIFMDGAKTVTATFQKEWIATLTIAGDIPTLMDMTDFVYFGESVAATDGIDKYIDVHYPGEPPEPYVAAWIATGLDPPDDRLERDIREYPGEYPNAKVWDLWVKTDGAGETVPITMTWIEGILLGNEYDFVGLFDYLSGDLLKDMTAESTFSFVADHGMGYHFQIICSWNHAPVANDDEYTTNENTPLIVDEALGVLWNDIDEDGDTLTASWVSGPSKGTLTLDPDGSFEYVPDTGATGPDSFVYEVTDGLLTDQATVRITIVELKEIDVSVGWNLISMPAYEKDFDKTKLVVEFGGDYYTWEEATTGTPIILEYTYGWDNGAYVDDAYLTRGDGYWLWSYQICKILVPSDAVPENHITTFDDGEGWYLVGAPYTVDLKRGNTRIHYNGELMYWTAAANAKIILLNLFDWDRATQNYVVSDPLDRFFESGYGYWMYVYKQCSLKRF